jgi:hypothetical protein
MTNPEYVNPSLIKGFNGLAKYLHVSIPTARKLVEDGIVTAFRHNSVVLFNEEKVLREMSLLENNTK